MHGSNRIVGLLAVLALAACGGGGDGNSATPPPVVVVVPGPTASFSAASSAAANQVVVFDAAASTSGDGSALSYAWDFGDGQHGGGKAIARSFASAGTRSVTLLVTDGAGRQATQARSVTISAPATAGSAAAHGRILGLDGVAIEGVAVAQAGLGSTANAAATSDASGQVALTLDTGVPLSLRLSKPGFADQFVTLRIPAGSGSDVYFEATLRARDAAQTLADTSTGGALSGRDGASITLPAAALVDGTGAPASGPVQIAMTPVDVTAPGAGGFPGSFDGIQPDGTTTPIVSFGTVEFVLSSGADRLQLAPGKTATIEVPIYAARRTDGSVLAVGDTTPLWSLDEATSMWIQEGSGLIVASAASPSGLAMRATVAHLSWWNSDLGFDPYGPQPKCVYDTDSGNPGGLDTFATATVCNLLAEIDRGPGNSAALGLAARAKALATTLSPRVAGYRRQALIPIAGGQTLPVPSGVDIALNATALNGTWVGRTVVNGAFGVQEQVLVKMRPIATTGPAPEAIVAPFDAVRSLQTGQTALYAFTGAAAQYARITVSDANGSALTGHVRLLQGTTALGAADFGAFAGTLVALLPADGAYVIELTGVANTPGAYRLQLELLGGRQSETLAFPFDATRTLPAFTSYRGSFSVAAPTTVYLAFSGQRFAPALLRVIGPDASVVISATSAGLATQPLTLALPAAGVYAFEVSWQDAQGGSFRVTAEPTSWLAISDGLDVQSSFATIDLIADRNGRPVVGYTRTVVVGQQTQVLYLLRRWTGTMWESVAADLAVDLPCNAGTGTAGIAFDSANEPLIAYASSTATGGSLVTVQKFVAGAWQGVGPAGGVLPTASPFSSACMSAPMIVVDPSDRPVVAYRTSNTVTVQRFDGNAWVGLASASGDSFDSISGSFDLRFDPDGQLYFALSQNSVLSVRRFNAAPGAGWEGVGANGGRLPEFNTAGLDKPQLRFVAAGRPIVAAVASVGSVVTSAGVAVYRFDGAAWSTSGGYQTGPDSYLINTPALGFALLGGDAVVAWSNATRDAASAPVVERNTAAGWSAIGSGAGEIVQYTQHGITPDASALDARLLQVGTELYQTIIVRSPDASGAKLTLLRKVAN